MAVRGVNQIIALSPGVVLQDNTVFIRGGRQDEVGFYLEGVPITNKFGGTWNRGSSSRAYARVTP